MIVIEGSGVPAGLEEEISRLESALAALTDIAAGRLPSDAGLDACPVVDPWALAVRPAPCLTGGLHGHPTLRSRAVRTSELLVLAPGLGWARTLSRFYRLGRPAGTGRAS